MPRNLLSNWDIPWRVAVEIRRLKYLMEKRDVMVEHTCRERNKLANFLANHVISFVGTNILFLSNESQLPREAKIIQNMEKQ